MSLENVKEASVSQPKELNTPNTDPKSSVSSQSPSISSQRGPTTPVSEVLSGLASHDSKTASTESSQSSPATLSNESSEQQQASTTEAQDKIGSKFAALSRKERQIFALQEKVKADQATIAQERAKMQAELASERAKVQADLKAVQDFNELKKMNPLKAMESLGFTVQQLNEMFLNDGKPTPEYEMQRLKSEMQSQLDSYKKEQEDRLALQRKEQEDQQKQRLEAEKAQIEQEQVEIIDNFRGEIGNFIRTNSNSYELTSLNDPEGSLVYSVVAEQFDKTGRVLSIKEASDLVEAYYERKVQENLATKKFRAKVSPPASQAATNEARQANETQPSTAKMETNSKTLTNSMNSGSTASSRAATSEQERIKRALAVLG